MYSWLIPVAVEQLTVMQFQGGGGRVKFETSGDTTSLILDFKRFAQKYNLIIKMVKGLILLVFAFVICLNSSFQSLAHK